MTTSLPLPADEDLPPRRARFSRACRRSTSSAPSPACRKASVRSCSSADPCSAGRRSMRAAARSRSSPSPGPPTPRTSVPSTSNSAATLASPTRRSPQSATATPRAHGRGRCARLQGSTEISNDVRLSDATLERLIERWGNAGAAELILCCGYYNMVSRFLESARVPSRTRSCWATTAGPAPQATQLTNTKG